jgi:hypothetical protein
MCVPSLYRCGSIPNIGFMLEDRRGVPDEGQEKRMSGSIPRMSREGNGIRDPRAARVVTQMA